MIKNIYTVRSILNNNVLNNFIAKVTCFPLSVKQVIMLHLYKDLRKTLSDEFIMGTDTDNFVYLYEPKLSFVAKLNLKKELKDLMRIYTIF